MQYKFNNKTISLTSPYGNSIDLNSKIFLDALNETHFNIDKILKDIPVNIFEILGMRNLSAFIGELYAKSLANVSNNLFISNPHQDGYPDLLLMDSIGLDIYQELLTSNQGQSKSPFSPFPNGGIEVKATVGSVPTPAICAKRGFTKPSLGDTRIHLLKGYDWKSHHRETNDLLGLMWDFIDGSPRITAIFFSNNLFEDDWGKIVQPKAGGGRTTSVSIMTRQGVKKMYNNWICVLDNPLYIDFLNKYNKDNLL